MPSITLSRVDPASLGPRWQALEREADGSFFQGWTWVGCLAAQRFPDPVLLAAESGGREVGLALFNRTRDRFGRTTLWLGESGDPALDACGPSSTASMNGVPPAPSARSDPSPGSTSSGYDAPAPRRPPPGRPPPAQRPARGLPIQSGGWLTEGATPDS